MANLNIQKNNCINLNSWGFINNVKGNVKLSLAKWNMFKIAKTSYLCFLLNWKISMCEQVNYEWIPNWQIHLKKF